MGKRVSRGQALSLASRFITQVNWDQLDGDKLQKDVLELSKDEFERRFTAFLSNGAELMVYGARVLHIDRGKDIDPSHFERPSYLKELKDRRDERSHQLTKVDFSQVSFETGLEESENSIKGVEQVRRLKENDYILLDGRVAEELIFDYRRKKNESLLEWLYWTRGITYINFPGSMFETPGSGKSPLIPILYRDDAHRWNWYALWLEHEMDKDKPSVVLKI